MSNGFFIVGATGYTGAAVVHQLCAAGIPVVAHIRPDSPKGEAFTEQFKHLGVVVERTAWEHEAMKAVLLRHQPTHIFSLLGTTKSKNRFEAQRGNQTSYESIDRDLSLLLLAAVLDSIKEGLTAPRYLFLSSMGVSDGTRNRYLRARAEVEKALKKTEIPWLIAQPAFISGEDREEKRPLERFGALITDGVLGALAGLGMTGPQEQLGTLSGGQLAEGLIAWALDNEAARLTLSAAQIRSRVERN